MADLAEKIAELVEVVGPVRPGDTLIFRMARLSKAEFDEFNVRVGEVLKDKAPDVQVMVVGNVDQILHYRPAKDD